MSFLKNSDIENILGREQHKELISINGQTLDYKKILITGSGGSIGNALISRL